MEFFYCLNDITLTNPLRSKTPKEKAIFLLKVLLDSFNLRSRLQSKTLIKKETSIPSTKMHFDGTFNVKAPKDKVFNLLMDPNQISQCMPDLQKLEIKSPEDYNAVIKAGVSFIRGDFNMHFTVVEKNPPTHAKLVAHGTGIGSTIDMDTFMDLSDGPNGGTTMKWAADAKIGGRIASVGQRLIEGQAQKIIKQLFSCLEGKLNTP